MAEYSKFSEGEFTSDGAAKFISLGFLPKSVRILNKTAYSSNTNNVGKVAEGLASAANGTAYVTASTGANQSKDVTITTGGFSFIEAGTYQFGPVVSDSGAATITQANPANVNITAHGFVTGDTVWLYNTTDMENLGGIPYTVTRVDADNFTIRVNTSVAGSFPDDGVAASAKKLLYPDLYIPFMCYIVSLTRGATTTLVTSVNHNFVVGQQVRLIIPENWGCTELNELKGYITAATSSTGSVTIDINSSAASAFVFPTPGQAELGQSFAQIIPIGDSNYGFTGPTYRFPDQIPGAFAANTRQGFVIGVGDGTTVLQTTSDLIHWWAEAPDQYI